MSSNIFDPTAAVDATLRMRAGKVLYQDQKFRQAEQAAAADQYRSDVSTYQAGVEAEQARMDAYNANASTSVGDYNLALTDSMSKASAYSAQINTDANVNRVAIERFNKQVADNAAWLAKYPETYARFAGNFNNLGLGTYDSLYGHRILDNNWAPWLALQAGKPGQPDATAWQQGTETKGPGNPTLGTLRWTAPPTFDTPDLAIGDYKLDLPDSPDFNYTPGDSPYAKSAEKILNQQRHDQMANPLEMQGYNDPSSFVNQMASRKASRMTLNDQKMQQDALSGFAAQHAQAMGQYNAAVGDVASSVSDAASTLGQIRSAADVNDTLRSSYESAINAVNEYTPYGGSKKQYVADMAAYDAWANLAYEDHALYPEYLAYTANPKNPSIAYNRWLINRGEQDVADLAVSPWEWATNKVARPNPLPNMPTSPQFIQTQFQAPVIDTSALDSAPTFSYQPPEPVFNAASAKYQNMGRMAQLMQSLNPKK